MARLVGFIANRPDLCNRFAEHERSILTAARGADGADPEDDWGWGVGFIHAGENLLKRRPIDEKKELSIADMIDDVRSDILIAQVRRATVGSLRTDNTHPFRYRQWLFADKGTVGKFGDLGPKLRESLPPFLRRSVRGDTDSEVVFHLFLSFMHDAGDLDRLQVPADRVASPLRSALGLLDRLGKESSVEATADRNMLLATPDYLVAVHRGRPMGYRVLVGREDFEPLYKDLGPTTMRMPDLAPCRLVVVASDFDGDELPQGWTAIPHGSVMAFSRTEDPQVLYAP